MLRLRDVSFLSSATIDHGESVEPLGTPPPVLTQPVGSLSRSRPDAVRTSVTTSDSSEAEITEMSVDVCEDTIDTCESLGFGSFRAGKNHHGALQIVVPEAVCNTLVEAIRPWVDMGQVEARAKEMMMRDAWC
jgi:hypothetical protein